MSKLLFGVHMHQPVGNSFDVIEKAVNSCYFPFFNTIKDFDIKFAFHSSGWILEVIKEKFPTLFEIIKKLAIKGNIEFFTGGFYEPILAVIPSADRIAQIEKLNKFLKDNFNIVPKGLWLTERVWDYSIFNDLVDLGIEYVMVDDFHLISSGYENIDGYYISENEGKVLKFIPISQKLRYAIPFADLPKTLDLIQKNKYNIMFDDLEKFGMWPNSYTWCYEKNWLKDFFSKVEHISIHFNELVSTTKPISLAYIQNVSYPEMQEWCLNADNYLKYKNFQKILGIDNKKFLKGCMWKNFFNKYPESNYIHKRMLDISMIQKSDNLYKAQDNDVFWHGVFGGIYLGILRENVYKYLLLAEKEIKREFLTKKDIDLDGNEEIIIKTSKLFIVFNHKGEMIELSDIENLFNYQNTISRKKEGYFLEKFSKKTDNKEILSIHDISYQIPDGLIFDRYLRYSFIVYEIFEDFSYNTFLKDKFKKQEIKFNYTNKLIFSSKEIIKKFVVNDNQINFEIDANKQIAIEFNFYKEFTNQTEIFSDKLILNNLILKLDKKCQIFIFDLCSYSKTEEGYQQEKQGISIAILTDTMIKGSLYVRN